MCIRDRFNGDAHLSLEQAHNLNLFLAHTESEAKYFLLMVQKERAGTKSLQNFLHQQMEEIRSAQKVGKHSDVKELLSNEDQQTYYSAWYYSAIHMALMIGRLQNIDSLANYLNLPKETAKKVIKFLLTCGLAKREGKSLKVGESRIHLDKKSSLISQHLSLIHI